MEWEVSAETQFRPDYTCQVPLSFGDDVVGYVHIDPEQLRQAALKVRLRNALGPPRSIPAKELPEILPKLKDANVDAVLTTLHVCETLKQKHEADRFLAHLAADTFLTGGELSGRRRKYLAQAGLALLEMPTIRAWVDETLAAKKAVDVRDFLQLLTPGKPGRKRRIDHAARRTQIENTRNLFEAHVSEIETATNPSDYFEREMIH